jgi:hypothetical protein
VLEEGAIRSVWHGRVPGSWPSTTTLRLSSGASGSGALSPWLAISGFWIIPPCLVSFLNFPTFEVCHGDLMKVEDIRI